MYVIFDTTSAYSIPCAIVWSEREARRVCARLHRRGICGADYVDADEWPVAVIDNALMQQPQRPRQQQGN